MVRHRDVNSLVRTTIPGPRILWIISNLMSLSGILSQIYVAVSDMTCTQYPNFPGHHRTPCICTCSILSLPSGAETAFISGSFEAGA